MFAQVDQTPVRQCTITGLELHVIEVAVDVGYPSTEMVLPSILDMPCEGMALHWKKRPAPSAVPPQVKLDDSSLSVLLD